MGSFSGVPTKGLGVASGVGFHLEAVIVIFVVIVVVVVVFHYMLSIHIVRPGQRKLLTFGQKHCIAVLFPPSDGLFLQQLKSPAIYHCTTS